MAIFSLDFSSISFIIDSYYKISVLLSSIVYLGYCAMLSGLFDSAKCLIADYWWTELVVTRASVDEWLFFWWIEQQQPDVVPKKREKFDHKL